MFSGTKISIAGAQHFSSGLVDYAVSIEGKVGGLSNWDERTLSVDFAFLDKDVDYQAIIYKDGINAAKQASDYAVQQLMVNSKSQIEVNFASGGGVVIRLSPKN